MEFSKEELKEFALALQELSAKRYQYLLDKTNQKYRKDNEKYLKLDNDLIRKVTTEIKKLKEQE